MPRENVLGEQILTGQDRTVRTSWPDLVFRGMGKTGWFIKNLAFRSAFPGAPGERSCPQMQGSQWMFC